MSLKTSRNRVGNWLYIAGTMQALQNDIITLDYNAWNRKYGTNKKDNTTLEAEFRRTYGELKKSRQPIDKQRYQELKDAYDIRKNPPPSLKLDLIGILTRTKYRKPSANWQLFWDEFVSQIDVWDNQSSSYEFNLWNNRTYQYYFWSNLPDLTDMNVSLDFCDNIMQFYQIWFNFAFRFQNIGLICHFVSDIGNEQYIQSATYPTLRRIDFLACIDDLRTKLERFIRIQTHNSDPEEEADYEWYKPEREEDEDEINEETMYLERVGFIFFAPTAIIPNPIREDLF